MCIRDREVDARGDMVRIHDEIDNIERELQETLNCHATIHMDPVETENETVKQLRRQTARAVAGLDSRLSIHDFRMVQGEDVYKRQPLERRRCG